MDQTPLDAQAVTLSHCEDLAGLRKLIRKNVLQLENWSELPAEEAAGQMESFLGGRETVLSALVKLAQLQMKLIPLEQELLQTLAERSAFPTEEIGLSDEDWELLELAVGEYKKLRDTEK